MGSSVTYTINCNYTIAAKLNTIETRYCRYRIVNTLHEGDNVIIILIIITHIVFIWCSN